MLGYISIGISATLLAGVIILFVWVLMRDTSKIEIDSDSSDESDIIYLLRVWVEVGVVMEYIMLEDLDEYLTDRLGADKNEMNEQSFDQLFE